MDGKDKKSVLLLMLVQLSGRSLHLGKGIGVRVKGSVSRYPWNLESWGRDEVLVGETSGRGFLESGGKNRERADAEEGLWCRGPARSRKVCSFIGMGFL